MTKEAVAEISQQYLVEAAEKRVPAGYKQTEVGVIPEDWKTVELGDLLSYEQPTRYLVKSSDYLENGTIPVLTAGKTFILGYTSELDNLYTNLPVIIFDDFTTGSQYVDFPFKAKSSAMKMLRPRNEQIPLQLVYSALNSVDFIVGDHKRHWISEFSKLKIAWPATNEEQAAIANALSDTDALLSELEKLIAKKQAIKTATMQQLLTGRTRLPQFAQRPDGSKKGYKQSELGEIPEDWASVNLGGCGEVCMCKRIFSSQTLEVGLIPFYKIGTFGKKADAYISKQTYTEYKAKYSFPKKGDVLISAAGTLGRTVIYDGEPAYFQDSNIVWLDIDKSKLSNVYLYHYYKVIKWASTEGSTIARLYNGIIKASLIALPPVEEQTAIASILSDMDEEIQALEQRLNKTRQIKQGMMQQLLTGKIRLVEGGKNV